MGVSTLFQYPKGDLSPIYDALCKGLASSSLGDLVRFSQASHAIHHHCKFQDAVKRVFDGLAATMGLGRSVCPSHLLRAARVVRDAAGQTEKKLSALDLSRWVREVRERDRLLFRKELAIQIGIHPDQIKQLPSQPDQVRAWFGMHSRSLASLKSLWLANRKMVYLPEEVSYLSSLEELYCQGNRLIALPRELKCLSKLRILNLSDNVLQRGVFSNLPARLFKPREEHLLPFGALDLSQNPLNSIEVAASKVKFTQPVEWIAESVGCTVLPLIVLSGSVYALSGQI